MTAAAGRHLKSNEASSVCLLANQKEDEWETREFDLLYQNNNIHYYTS